MNLRRDVFNFGKMAESYDAWYRTSKGRTYDRLEKAAVLRALQPLRRDRKLLDVGCGTGHWSAFFSDHGFEVTGVDLAPEMIAVAGNKRIPHATFQVADGEALPFRDNRFDVVVSITTLEFVSDVESVVREMARCARQPGGRLLVGILNSLATLNIERRNAGAKPYADARLFTPAEVKQILMPYGKPIVKTAGFVPRSPGLHKFAWMLDFGGRLVRSQRGAFIVGSLRF